MQITADFGLFVIADVFTAPVYTSLHVSCTTSIMMFVGSPLSLAAEGACCSESSRSHIHIRRKYSALQQTNVASQAAWQRFTTSKCTHTIHYILQITILMIKVGYVTGSEHYATDKECTHKQVLHSICKLLSWSSNSIMHVMARRQSWLHKPASAFLAGSITRQGHEQAAA